MDSIRQPGTQMHVGPGVPLKHVRDYRWLVGVWVIVAFFAGVTAIWSQHVGVPLRDPGGVIFRSRILSSVVLMGLLILVDVGVRVGRPGWTVGKADLRNRWPKERLAIALSGLLAYHIVYICYRNLKSWNAFNQLHDNQLLRLDKMLFFRHSPAVLIHDLFGEHLAAQVLAAVYGSFTYLVPVSLVAALVFVDRIRDGYVFLMSAMWVWILGALPTTSYRHSAHSPRLPKTSATFPTPRSPRRRRNTWPNVPTSCSTQPPATPSPACISASRSWSC